MHAMKKPRKFNALKFEQKKAILDEVDGNPEKLETDIAREYGTCVSTLSTILKNREKILVYLADDGKGKARKRYRSVEFPEVYKVMYR